MTSIRIEHRSQIPAIKPVYLNAFNEIGVVKTVALQGGSDQRMGDLRGRGATWVNLPSSFSDTLPMESVEKLIGLARGQLAEHEDSFKIAYNV